MRFSEQITEARRIAQHPRALHAGSWYSTYVVRHFSIYISYFFWKLGVSANALTIASGLAALIGSVCIVFNRIGLTIAAAVLWQLWYILDDVDGEVARLHHRESLLGVYLDRLSHIVVNPTFGLAFGVHVCMKDWSLINAVATMVLYAAFNWAKQVKSISSIGLETKNIEDKVKLTNYRFNNKSILSWVRFILVQSFGEIGQIYIFPAVIILNQVIEYDITRPFFYVYTFLFLAYTTLLIVRNGCAIRRMDFSKMST